MRHLTTAFVAALMLAGATANAQFGRDPYGNPDPYGRNRGYGGYGDRDRSGYGYGSNGLVQSVQEHLRRAASFGRPHGKEYDRFNNAMRHLSEFDAKMSRGHYDRGKLDKAIEDVNNVVRHNHLDRRDRNMLATDVERLRDFRARYRY